MKKYKSVYKENSNNYKYIIKSLEKILKDMKYISEKDIPVKMISDYENIYNSIKSFISTSHRFI